MAKGDLGALRQLGGYVCWLVVSVSFGQLERRHTFVVVCGDFGCGADLCGLLGQ